MECRIASPSVAAAAPWCSAPSGNSPAGPREGRAARDGWRRRCQFAAAADSRTTTCPWVARCEAVSSTVVSLKAQPLFAALDQAELLSLAGRAHLRRYTQGEVLFAEGEACEGLYVLVSGRVKIFKTSASGREQVLAVEEPGSSFAELPVFDGGPYPASASAMSDTEVLFISRADVRALCLERPEVALKILQVVAARQRRVVAVIEELSFTTVRHRLVSWLLRQATANGGRPAAARSSRFRPVTRSSPRMSARCVSSCREISPGFRRRASSLSRGESSPSSILKPWQPSSTRPSRPASRHAPAGSGRVT